MAVTLNASTTTGLVQSADTSGIIELQSNGTTAVTIDTNQRAAFVAGTAALPAITTTGDTNTGVFFPAADTIAFSEGGAESMRIDSAGVVSIKNTGSTADFVSETSTSLIVGNGSGTQAMTVYSGTANNGALYFADGNTGDATYRGGVQYLHGSDAMRIFTSAAERMRITSGGDLCVGVTSSNSARLAATQSTSNNVLFLVNSNATTVYGMQIYYSGKVPNNTGEDFIYCGDSSPRFVARSNGGIANYSANNVNLSDAREKTNIELATNYLDKICAIPVKTFNYIDQNLEEDGDLNLGVIAQDVQSVAPELVTESNWAGKDEPKKMRLSIYQTDLQYALMKAIQELNAKVDAQAVRIAELEGAK
jgi:hypothetical protein